jgi:hypothetical protein
VLCKKPIETTGPPVDYSTVHPPLDPLVSRHHHQAGSSSSGQIVRRLTVGNSRPLRPSESLPGQPGHLTAPGGFWTTTRAARASNHRSSSAGEAIELGSQVEDSTTAPPGRLTSPPEATGQPRRARVQMNPPQPAGRQHGQGCQGEESRRCHPSPLRCPSGRAERAELLVGGEFSPHARRRCRAVRPAPARLPTTRCGMVWAVFFRECPFHGGRAVVGYYLFPLWLLSFPALATTFSRTTYW